ncbi:MAG: hypothetical protein ABIR08_06955 [Sphingomonas sp.]
MSADANGLAQSFGLLSRLPPDKPFVSLSHAISWIALRRSVAGPVLSKLLGLGKMQCHERIDQNDRLDRAIKSAVEKFADLGLGEQIEILGQKYAHVFDDDRDDKIPTERIPAQRFADYRGFDTLDDTLFPAPYRKVELAWRRERAEHDSPLENHYRFIMVNRADLMREFPSDLTKSLIELGRFTVAEMDEWIRATPLTGMKAARNAFMKDPRAKGLSGSFESSWNAIKKKPVGRPLAAR